MYASTHEITVLTEPEQSSLHGDNTVVIDGKSVGTSVLCENYSWGWGIEGPSSNITMHMEFIDCELGLIWISEADVHDIHVGHSGYTITTGAFRIKSAEPTTRDGVYCFVCGDVTGQLVRLFFGERPYTLCDKHSVNKDDVELVTRVV